MATHNFINRLVFHLIVPAELSGRDALEQTQACYKNYVEKTIEDVFKLYDHQDICINELEIDLGPVSPEEIPDKLYSALEKELSKHIREKRIIHDPALFNNETENVTKGEDAILYNDYSDSFREKESGKDSFSCFLTYLKNPQIPWYLSSVQFFDIEALARNALDQCWSNEPYFKRLVSVISGDLRFYYRFVRLLNAEQLDRIIRRYIAINGISNKAIYTDLYSRIDNLLTRYPSHKKEVREWFFECFLYNQPSKKQVEKSDFRPVIDDLKSELSLHDSKSSSHIAIYRLLQQLGFLTESEMPVSHESGDEPDQHSQLKRETDKKEENECISNSCTTSLRGGTTKQSRNIFTMDCFASLAMTTHNKNDNLKCTRKNLFLYEREIDQDLHLQQQKDSLQEDKKIYSSKNEDAPDQRLLHKRKSFQKDENTFSSGSIDKPDQRLVQQQKYFPEDEKAFVQYLSRIHKNKMESFRRDNRIHEIMPEEKQRFLINNAGLVIFNPMIPSFFRHLGLLDKKDHFKSDRHRIRAVHLLQVLTGIRSKHYDHLLQLNKIICGLDTGFPLDPAFRATPREKEEATDLLESVLSHWKVMEGTSVDGFRESFIQRRGIIEKSGLDWILHIENKSIDILLDDLPWSIGLLSFPWNEFAIHVDWKR